MKKRHFLTAAGLCLGTALASSPVLALEARVAKDTAASPAEAWAAIGDFCNISNWHPVVTKCEISTKDGATFRTLGLKGGGVLLEKQVAFDKAAMTYSYAIIEGPLPVANYQGTMVVRPKGKGATIEWSGKFDAKGVTDDEAVKNTTGIYESGIDSLLAKLGK